MRYRNGRYARQISRNINSGIYLGPTQGLSSPKNNRRACLCTDRNTYSRDCCNGNLIAQGVGNIQAPADTISTSTTTTTSGPTTTTTSAPTTTSTSTTSTSTSTSTTAAPTSTSTSTSTSTTSTSTSTSTTSTSTSTSTTTAAPTTTSTTSTSTSTTSTSTSTSTSTTTAAPLPIVTGSLLLWNHFTDYNSGSGTMPDRSGNNNTGLVSGSTMSVSSSFGLAFNGTDNFITYPEPFAGGNPTTDWTVQMYGTWDVTDSNLDFFTHFDYTDGWDIALTPDGRTVVRCDTGGGTDISYTAPDATLTLVTIIFDGTNNRVKLYANTTSIADNAVTVVGWDATTVPMTFGWNANTDATYFKGTFKDITLYSKVLTSGEITTNYNAFIAL